MVFFNVDQIHVFVKKCSLKSQNLGQNVNTRAFARLILLQSNFNKIYPNTSSKERTSNNMSAALKWREKNELIIKGRTSNKLARQLFECRCPTQLITTPTSPSVTCCYFDMTHWLLNKRNLGTLVLSLLLLALWLHQKGGHHYALFFRGIIVGKSFSSIKGHTSNKKAAGPKKIRPWTVTAAIIRST